MEEYTNRELGIMLKNLTKQIKDGFSGIHTRQDLTNGNVKTNSENITRMKIWRAKIIGALIIMNIIIVPLSLTLIINFIINR